MKTDNQIICEQLLYECWHRRDNTRSNVTTQICSICDKEYPWSWKFPDFSLWPDKGRLLDWMMADEKHEWTWEAFENWVYDEKFMDTIVKERSSTSYLLNNLCPNGNNTDPEKRGLAAEWAENGW